MNRLRDVVMMTEYVLDSSAILAVSNNETGAEQAASALAGGRVCSVNLAEVVTKFVEAGASFDLARLQVEDLALRTVDFDRDLAIRTGLLRKATLHKGLSLGDRACLALAMREGLPVMTADTAWSDLDLPVEVVLIR